MVGPLPGRLLGLSHLCLLVAAYVCCAPPASPADQATATDAAVRGSGDAALSGPAPWPASTAVLTPPQVVFPQGFRTQRVFIDAGHGAFAGNHGATSCMCAREDDFDLEVAEGLAAALDATGRFVTQVSRRRGQLVRYPARLDAALRLHADVVLSIHADARGYFESGFWSSTTTFCGSNSSEPGFSILWSDRGAPALVAKRHALASALAMQLTKAGFLAYTGLDYPGLYDPDPQQPGVFVDRHAPRQRVFFLHRPPMPSVVIETHHFLDPREVQRWQQPATRAAFYQAVLAALVATQSHDGR